MLGEGGSVFWREGALMYGKQSTRHTYYTLYKPDLHSCNSWRHLIENTEIKKILMQRWPMHLWFLGCIPLYFNAKLAGSYKTWLPKSAVMKLQISMFDTIPVHLSIADLAKLPRFSWGNVSNFTSVCFVL